MKKILSIILVLLLVFSFTGCKSNKKDDKLTILASNFPCYDFARAITKDVPNTSVEMLLKPGTEMHNYEPTPQDIIKISNSDMFIYIGGESDEWINELLKSINTKKTKVIRLMDYSENVLEDNSDEYDEHIWTGPRNSINIIKGLSIEISNIDRHNKKLYYKNASDLIDEYNKLDEKMWDIMKKSKGNIIVVGDRFPFKYLFEEYGLSYFAAFPGCSSETEASAKTISDLIKVTKDYNLPVVFKVDYFNGKIADTIANETGAKVLELKSGHNVTEEEFNNGVTLVDIMNNNIINLKEALQ